MSVLYDLMQIKELAALQDLETRILNYMESQRKFPSWKKRTAAEERGGQ
jgi:hypothetical protein